MTLARLKCRINGLRHGGTGVRGVREFSPELRIEKLVGAAQTSLMAAEVITTFAASDWLTISQSPRPRDV